MSTTTTSTTTTNKNKNCSCSHIKWGKIGFPFLPFLSLADHMPKTALVHSWGLVLSVTKKNYKSGSFLYITCALYSYSSAVI